MKIVTEEAVPLEEALEEYRSNDFFIKYGLLQLLVRLHDQSPYEAWKHYMFSTNACRRELTFLTTSAVLSMVTSASSLCLPMLPWSGSLLVWSTPTPSPTALPPSLRTQPSTTRQRWSKEDHTRHTSGEIVQWGPAVMQCRDLVLYIGWQVCRYVGSWGLNLWSVQWRVEADIWPTKHIQGTICV